MYVVGKSYLFRTVTAYWTGRVREITTTEIGLDEAAWIADTGRYAQAISTGALLEVEPVQSAILNRSAIVDAVEWSHALPRATV